MAVLLLLTGCAAPAAPAPVDEAALSAATASPTAPAASVPSARVGEPAPSHRVRFVPTSIQLPGRAAARVAPAATVDGRLVVPEQVSHVGWWDGSARAGDPFGSTVIAGHVDSATEGLGFFARLLRIERGQVVTLSDGRHRQRYRVVAVQTVAKQALATTSAAFDQRGNHRLVLITCTGRFRPERGGYDSNLVVTAEATGLAR